MVDLTSFNAKFDLLEKAEKSSFRFSTNEKYKYINRLLVHLGKKENQ